MDLLELIKKLMSFKSVTDDKNISADCIDFIVNYVKNWNEKINIREAESNGFKSVLFSNTETLDLDVLEIGHIDVVSVSKDEIFQPRVEGNILYGRGGGDMKGFVAVALETLKYVITKNLNLKYGLLIVSNEETGGQNGAEYWTQTLKLKTKILLDPDTGKKLNTIIYKSKGSAFVKLISRGENAHGSRPWLGIDAIDNLIATINNIRTLIPAYSKVVREPENKWVETMHVGLIKGGKAANAIADYVEAVLDIRFTEKYDTDSIIELIKRNIVGDIDVVLEEGGKVVFNDKNNKYMELYSNILKKHIKDEVNFDFTTGASDSRYFSNSNTVIIANQADCGELHSDGEWIDLIKLEEFNEIRKEFLEELGNSL